MGLCKTSNFSIFTFINASDLKFCTRSYSSCVYRRMRFKVSNGKVGKLMTSHFRTLSLQLLSLDDQSHHDKTDHSNLRPEAQIPDSEDDYHSDSPNVSHQQKYFWRLLSPGRSHKTNNLKCLLCEKSLFKIGSSNINFSTHLPGCKELGIWACLLSLVP